MASSSRFTLLPTSFLASQDPNTETTLPSLIATSENLAADAKEALPYAFDNCTYSLGYLRQSVWSCIDCGEKGVCYGCSITCHGEHRLVELWTKRHFRCDCPTSAMSEDPGSSTSTSGPYSHRKRCKLNAPESQPQELNADNRYGKTFKGVFCRCGRDYDPETETEAMVVCIGCEDWFHESCLNLSSKKDPTVRATTAATEDEDGEEENVLIPSDSYDGLVCAECVRSNTFLSAKMGTLGFMIIEPEVPEGWRVIGREERIVEAEAGEAGEMKRRIEQDATHDSSDPKRDNDGVKIHGKGDIFLAHGIRDRLNDTLPADTAASLPFPLIDEEIYEPPKDEDEEETMEQITERVVGALPRVQAIEALHGYQNMKDRLRTMLAAHVVSGQTVSKEDIDRVFAELRAAR
ncbi:hypothetical protein BD324DRAFT_667125 [Kockovaella imperatae]|uniref:UBR-type domain-containing protein n=1 Tax=Kockovaella imperatae TaxID=4999 RepID=A0A1Y1UP18_9TREE|nr:hypothetical protein BD324DRAFT_667125 [Kockovaella imperatae]ORX39781.1 hypothetical protein BD324DRAFT_667125 [Kockovaella imperatae]